MIEIKDNPDLQISKPVAIQRTRNWRSFLGELETHAVVKKIKAFNIPKSDIESLLNQPGVDAIRAYLGMDNTGIPNEIDLIFVGVDSNGKDMLDTSQGQLIYDLTTPCPAMCDETSELSVDPPQ